MPSKGKELQGFSSSSYFSEDVCFANERQVGILKSDSLPDQYAREKSIASSFENCVPAEYHRVPSLDHPQTSLLQGQNVNHCLNRLAVGAERATSHSLSLLKPIDHDPGVRSNMKKEPGSYFAEGGKINMMGSRYESSLFSSSFSELFSRKLRLSNNALCGHSVGTVASHYEEEELLQSTEEIEAQTIGNLLPDDDDLLSGVVDGLDHNIPSSSEDCMEEFDFFSSVGGMDLEDDISFAGQKGNKTPGVLSNGKVGDYNGSIVGEHPHGEHPSRTLFVRNINSNVEDPELKALFEQYGDIHNLYTACKHRGFVMISYYDIRAARNAMKALQNRPLRHRKLDIHYSIPKDNPSEKDINQDTIAVFNLDSSVSNDEIRQIFGSSGEIKEIHETPHRVHHKFIEFYDLRAAEAALQALNGSDIAGKRIKLEPSHSGGLRRSLGQQFLLEQDECNLYFHQSNPPMASTTAIPSGGIDGGIDNGSITGVQTPSMENTFHHGISSSVPNSLPSLLRGESISNQYGLKQSNHSSGQQKIEIHGTPAFHPHSLPEYHDGLSNGIHNSSVAATINYRPSERIENSQFGRINLNRNSAELKEVFGSAGNSSCSLPGHHYTWNISFNPQSHSVMWPCSPSFVNGICAAQPSQLHGLYTASSHLSNTALPMTNHHVGSAPVVNSSIWDRQSSYAAGESPKASGFHPGSLGDLRIANSPESMEFLSRNIFRRVSRNCMDLSAPSKTGGLHSHHPMCALFPGTGQMIPVMNSFDPPNDRARSRRNEANSNKTDYKKQYELDIDCIIRGEDKRTTLMIKNIPNKYTSKMLLAAIDERNRGTYDFIYLPIDFKNKCNVGYAFINMTDPSLIIPLYQTFNGKKWEKFNSEKVATLAYARIQGKASLIVHFQNSSLMNEDKRCRPILFHTDGPNAGDQVAFPMGVNVRVRPGKARGTNIYDENHESPSNMVNGEGSSQERHLLAIQKS